ncbi:MAG: hypothetical protein JNL04_21420 [Rhodospirillaceae bacterium]|nr:hypothetical protein [Rhodospirillaceae bacterium]
MGVFFVLWLDWGSRTVPAPLAKEEDVFRLRAAVAGISGTIETLEQRIGSLEKSYVSAGKKVGSQITENPPHHLVGPIKFSPGAIGGSLTGYPAQQEILDATKLYSVISRIEKVQVYHSGEIDLLKDYLTGDVAHRSLGQDSLRQGTTPPRRNVLAGTNSQVASRVLDLGTIYGARIVPAEAESEVNRLAERRPVLN